MKNYEKYAEELRGYEGSSFCNEFVIPHILKPNRRCDGTPCNLCHMLQTIWLFEEYEEPETDWSKVAVDTPILVRENENTAWVRRYFAKCENGDVWAWRDGLTRWTASFDDDITWWKYAKLAQSEESDEYIDR